MIVHQARGIFSLFLTVLLSLFVVNPSLLAELPKAKTPDSTARTQLALEKESSHLGFNLQSTLVSLKGQFKDFSGQLELNQENFSRSKVRLSIDFSSVEIQRKADTGFDFNQIFSVLKNQKAVFTSSEIIETGEGEYEVNGFITRGGQTWKMSLGIKPIQIDKTKSIFEVKTKGHFKDPTLGPLLSGVGEINSRLVFTNSSTKQTLAL